jgi:GrpB-like predicted nucleotidyltransferase (UPF0157 family)
MTDNDQKIVLKRYNPKWIHKFKAEKTLVEQTLGDLITGGVHHVGSTSVPGLKAKPIIDIMVGIDDLEKSKKCIPPLEKIEYCYYPYRPEIMHWFCKPSPSKREFHLYLMETTHPQWKAILEFRDYLIVHPEIAEEYTILKQKLAAQHKSDREAYTEAKTEFVNRIVVQAIDENLMQPK